jgi:hypothetical protein
MDVLLNKKPLSYLRTEERQRVLAALPPNMMVTLPYNDIVHSAGSMLQLCYNEATKAARVGRNGSSVLDHFILHLANTGCLRQHYKINVTASLNSLAGTQHIHPSALRLDKPVAVSRQGQQVSSQPVELNTAMHLIMLCCQTGMNPSMTKSACQTQEQACGAMLPNSGAHSCSRRTAAACAWCICSLLSCFLFTAPATASLRSLAGFSLS